MGIPLSPSVQNNGVSCEPLLAHPDLALSNVHRSCCSTSTLAIKRSVHTVPLSLCFHQAYQQESDEPVVTRNCTSGVLAIPGGYLLAFCWGKNLYCTSILYYRSVLTYTGLLDRGIGLSNGEQKNMANNSMFIF